MRIFSIIQAILALSLVLFGLLALFGIGITGLMFLLLGVLFAVIAGLVQDQSRAAVVVALAADAALAVMAARRLQSLYMPASTTPALHQTAGVLDYVLPCAALLLVGIGALAVAMDWRTLRQSAWF